MLSFHRKAVTAETISVSTMLSLPKRNTDHTKKKNLLIASPQIRPYWPIAQ